MNIILKKYDVLSILWINRLFKSWNKTWPIHCSSGNPEDIMSLPWWRRRDRPCPLLCSARSWTWAPPPAGCPSSRLCPRPGSTGRSRSMTRSKMRGSFTDDGLNVSGETTCIQLLPGDNVDLRLQYLFPSFWIDDGRLLPSVDGVDDNLSRVVGARSPGHEVQSGAIGQCGDRVTWRCTRVTHSLLNNPTRRTWSEVVLYWKTVIKYL